MRQVIQDNNDYFKFDFTDNAFNLTVGDLDYGLMIFDLSDSLGQEIGNVLTFQKTNGFVPQPAVLNPRGSGVVVGKIEHTDDTGDFYERILGIYLNKL